MQPTRRLALAGLALLAAGGLWWTRARGAGAKRAETLYAAPLPPPEGPMQVFHLGHSLVGRDMPAMLAQLAGHGYHSQLGWGTSLKEHWEPDLPINGFEAENAHPFFRPARDSMATENYQAVVLTEMVEIADAVRYHDSAAYLAKWAEAAGPARVYLYETWHYTDDPAGWLARIDSDLSTFWEGRVLHPALAKTQTAIHLIPAGQVMAAFARRHPDATQTLFATNDDGTRDTIHLSDLGAYLVALTHYAVLYHRSPEGLPQALLRADGTAADAPSAEMARDMQQIVWQVVTRMPQTGVAS